MEKEAVVYLSLIKWLRDNDIVVFHVSSPDGEPYAEIDLNRDVMRVAQGNGTDDEMTAMMLHETAHVLQADEGDIRIGDFDWEADAWSIGFALGRELGIPITQEMVNFGRSSYMTYKANKQATFKFSKKLEFKHSIKPKIEDAPDDDWRKIHIIEAYLEGREVGFIEWAEPWPSGRMKVWGDWVSVLPKAGIMDIQVDADMRRQGIGRALVEEARKIHPDLEHSTFLSPDGKLFAQAVGSTAPKIIVGEPDSIQGQTLRHPFSAIIDGKEVGYLLVGRSFPDSAPYIKDVEVLEEYRRQGIGTALLEAARKMYPTLTHDNLQTEDARAWSQAIGAKTAVKSPEELEKIDPGWLKTWTDEPSMSKPPKWIVDAREEYKKRMGMPLKNIDYTTIRQDYETSKKIAEDYDAAEEWTDEALASFEAMRIETIAQYRYLTEELGLEVIVDDGDHYTNHKELTEDVDKNHRMYVLSTESTGGHPFFTNEENDMFRTVHDFFGHVATGRDFDRHGEEAAWVSHSQMYTRAARAAMTMETRGQNCFSYDTKVILKNGVAPIGEMVGEGPQEVMTEKGWQKAEFNYFGKQDVQDIIFGPAIPNPKGNGWRLVRSNHRVTERATPTHKWVLIDGTITTSLKVGDVVRSQVTDYDNRDEYENGWVHGFLFGDGTYDDRKKNAKAFVRLCADKDKQHLERLARRGYVTYPVSANGDPVVHIPWNGAEKYSPKMFPTKESSSYMKGFVEGWLDADGTKGVSGRDSVMVSSSHKDAVGWLIEYAAFAGYLIRGITYAIGDTNFGPRTRPLANVTLSSTGAWKVIDILPLPDKEPVFCATVPKTGTFTLASGILTGNCNFIWNGDFPPQKVAILPQEDWDTEVFKTATSDDWRKLALTFTLKDTQDLYGKPHLSLRASQGEALIGFVTWDKETGEIWEISTKPSFRRKGLATELYNRAKEIDSKVHHSRVQTDDGKAWSKTVAKTAAYEPDWEDLLRKLQHKGFTIDPATGRVPTRGYMVSREAHERKRPIGQATAEWIKDYAHEHRGLFDSDDWLGGWNYNNHGYLDVSINMMDRQEAINQGHDWHQESIYDVEADDYIYMKDEPRTAAKKWGEWSVSDAQIIADEYDYEMNWIEDCDSCGGDHPKGKCASKTAAESELKGEPAKSDGKNIIYDIGDNDDFGPPAVWLRGKGTTTAKEWLKKNGFLWNRGQHAYQHHLYKEDMEELIAALTAQGYNVMPQKKATKANNTFYHVTWDEYLDSILAEGLNATTTQYPHLYNTPANFLHEDFSSATSWASNQATMFKYPWEGQKYPKGISGSVLILEIEPPKGIKLQQDPNWSGAYKTHQNIPASAIRKIYTNDSGSWKRANVATATPPANLELKWKSDTVLASYLNGTQTGFLRVWPNYVGNDLHHTVSDIWVEYPYQRNGIGTAMWNEAKKRYPDLEHSPQQTPDGEGWAKTVSKIAAEANHKGMMIAFYPPKEVAEKLHIESGEPVEDMHVTLIYVGKYGEDPNDPDLEVSPGEAEEILDVVSEISKSWGPLEGVVGGRGIFGTEDGGVIWASVDVPGIEVLQVELQKRLKELELPFYNDHSFAPHMTLKYVDTGEGLNQGEPPIPIDIEFSEIVVVVAGERFVFPLTGTKKTAKIAGKKTMYHIAPVEVHDSILSEGINGAGRNRYEIQEAGNFLWKTKQAAEDWVAWEMNGNTHNRMIPKSWSNDWNVYEVRVDESTLKQDTSLRSAQYTTERIPPHDITKVYTVNWDYSRSDGGMVIMKQAADTIGGYKLNEAIDITAAAIRSIMRERGFEDRTDRDSIQRICSEMAYGGYGATPEKISRMTLDYLYNLEDVASAEDDLDKWEKLEKLQTRSWNRLYKQVRDGLKRLSKAPESHQEPLEMLGWTQGGVIESATYKTSQCGNCDNPIGKSEGAQCTYCNTKYCADCSAKLADCPDDGNLLKDS